MSGKPRPSSFADAKGGQSKQSNHHPVSSGSKFLTKIAVKVITVVATPAHGTAEPHEISYAVTKVIGNGSFGVVYQIRLMKPLPEETVAIKKVLQDGRFKNRELQLLKEMEHCNVVKLKYYFYTNGDKKEKVFLNLVMEYFPETLYRMVKSYRKTDANVPIFMVKLYMYQMFRSLAYIHSLGICHRDIKPQNLLLNSDTGILKLCDFGSSKHLVEGETNISYICSRYYRPPELIFGATEYTTKIDVWSAGCVLAEVIIGHPIFQGDNNMDQLVEIIKVLGTPTRPQILQMNPNYTEFKFPQIIAQPLHRVLHTQMPADAIDLLSLLLDYTPSLRITSLQACAHTFFNELRESNRKLPSGRDLPPLFNFTEHELKIDPSLNSLLLPLHATLSESQLEASGSKDSKDKNVQLKEADPTDMSPDI